MKAEVKYKGTEFSTDEICRVEITNRRVRLYRMFGEKEVLAHEIVLANLERAEISEENGK